MKNKHVGLLVIAIAVFFLFIVISFNNALATIVDTSCTHGDTCPMHATIKTQRTISYSLISLLVGLGALMAFFIKDETIVHREIIRETHHKSADKNEEKDLSNEDRKQKYQNLDADERKVMNIILREEGSIFQSDLIKETGLTKVKVSRLLDKLEGKKLIERKRRGMSNVVVQK